MFSADNAFPAHNLTPELLVPTNNGSNEDPSPGNPVSSSWCLVQLSSVPSASVKSNIEGSPVLTPELPFEVVKPDCGLQTAGQERQMWIPSEIPGDAVCHQQPQVVNKCSTWRSPLHVAGRSKGNQVIRSEVQATMQPLPCGPLVPSTIGKH